MGSPDTAYRFGPFCLERGAYRLLRDGAPLALAPKVIDLLFLLVSRPNSLVTKDEIFEALWPDVAVTDNAITQVMSDLRQALGDTPASPAFVQTVPRRGYRFIAPVEEVPQVHERSGRPYPAGNARPSSASPVPTGAAPHAPRGIAVLEFLNVTDDRDVAWLGTGLAETVTNDLRALHDLRVIDRVLIAAADRAGDGAGATRAAGGDLLVVGSFQRARDRLRVTARVIDVGTGEALVHAKADGEMAGVFDLQDEIVRQLIAGLRLNVTPTAAARLRARETSSLEAFRAATEGRTRLEALDPDEVPAAIALFERAIEIDPAYATAYVGLAHAKFWRYQASRARPQPDVEELDAAIRHAGQAVALDAELPEAHAALAFFLASADRTVEAVAAGRHAVALEPGNWRHQFRLGIAAWGEERLDALAFVVARFPQLAYAYFSMAMTMVARDELDRAADTLRTGLAASASLGAGRERFPASGLHWLLGLIHFAQGDAGGAQAELEREIALPGSRMYADEYAANASEGLGFLCLSFGDAEGASAHFARALERYPDRARSLAGLVAASRELGREDVAAGAEARARQSAAALARYGRTADAALADACLRAMAGDVAGATAALDALLIGAGPGHTGWSIPVEPWLRSARGEEGFHRLLARLRARGR
jgi:DNA-binding winged helix-turn-helix (wHTH) protein/tetratricopeptide (TPR) repeat protein